MKIAGDPQPLLFRPQLLDLLLGPVGGAHLVEPLLGLEEPLDLLQVHPERLA